MNRLRKLPHPGDALSADHAREQAYILRASRPISTPDIRVEFGPDGFRLFLSRLTRAVGGGLDLRKYAFGWLGTTGTTVHIRAGYMEGRHGYRAINAADVAVGGNEANPHLIIVTGTATGGAIATNSVSESTFNGDTSTEWRRVLYRVYVKNGSVVMDMIGAGVGGVVL